jgi:hypothetical protein
MAANLIGSVIVGFAAVVLGTALARGLTEPAIDRAAAGGQSTEAVAAEQLHPARTSDDQSNAVNVDALGEVGGHRDTNEGSE